MKTLLAETAMLAAHAEWLDGRLRNSDERAASFVRAEGFNAASRLAFGDSAPAFLSDQARELRGEANDAARTLPENAPELYAAAVRLMADGRYQSAADRLVKLTELEPDHFAGQFALAVCYENLGQTLRALERFQIAKPLNTVDGRPALHRGILLHHLSRFAEAEREFTEALRRDPTLEGIYLQRAFSRKSRGDLRGAVEDLTAEIEQPNGRKFIAVAIRAQVQEARGETAAAKADRATLDQLEPVTDLDYVARATRWLKTDPSKALADYEKALKVNPDCYAALMNKAHLFADAFNQPELALAAVQRAAKSYPGLGRVHAGQAVLLARLGKRDDAHKEAELSLILGADPEVTYQASNVFALTSDTHPEDRERAVVLFRQALREGYRKFDTIDTDPDLKNLRTDEGFIKALAAAKELIK